MVVLTSVNGSAAFRSSLVQEAAGYVLISALIIVPLMMLWPTALAILYHVHRMLSALTGAPFP